VVGFSVLAWLRRALLLTLSGQRFEHQDEGEGGGTQI